MPVTLTGPAPVADTVSPLSTVTPSVFPPPVPFARSVVPPVPPVRFAPTVMLVDAVSEIDPAPLAERAAEVVIVPPLVSETLPLSITAPVIEIVSAAVLPVFTLMGAAETPPVPLRVKLFVPVPSVTTMDVISALGIVIVAVPPPVTSAASLPVGAPNFRPPVSVKV